MERFYGEESSTDPRDVQPINYYAGTSQLFLQDLKTRNGKASRSDEVGLEMTYRDAETGAERRRWFRTTVGAMLDTDPHNVRKARALMAWTDLLIADAMGTNACDEELRTYGQRAGSLKDDAEIAFVNGLVRQRCANFELASNEPQRGVPFKVKVNSDVAILEVALQCGGQRYTDTLTGSDTVASFDAAPGRCQLILSGPVDLRSSVEVPQTGGEVRCVVRGGRVRCR